MSIVVDCGCMFYPGHPEDESRMRLIDRFGPRVYWGFDPHPAQNEYDGFAGIRVPQAETHVRRQAAWIFDGEIGLSVPPAVLNPLRTSVILEQHSEQVKCFDLARFLNEIGEPVILKLDVEGAEYTLIPHLVATGAIDKVALLLVEFHGDQARPPIPCPWETWV